MQCLVEWPKAVLCAFERDFLAVPQEALIATMEANQKFFPVLDAEGKLTEHFIGIANIESKDESEVRKGYERVIRPRFADAKFFFDEDLKQGLVRMTQGLESVTYQADLGKVSEKVDRVSKLAEKIAGMVGVDPQLASRAAEFAKADLQSRMVNEFPELQGIAGRYYAMKDVFFDDLSSNDRKQLADAIDEAYMPRFSGESIAPSSLGQVLAIAERLDTLAGCFVAGLKPTGNKDPFSLRRNALGLARTLIEGNQDMALAGLLREAAAGARHAFVFTKAEKLSASAENARQKGVKVDDVQTGSVETQDDSEVAQDIFDFILDRLRAYYADQGVTPQQFEAVAALMRPVAPSGAPTNATAALDAPAKPSASPVGAPEGATASTPQDSQPHARPTSTGASSSSGAGSLLDFDRRLKAIGEFAKLPEAEALAAANKRIRNILKKADIAIPSTVDTTLFVEDAERDLHAAVAQAIADTDDALKTRDYVAVLGRLARLRPEVDTFFDKVMVNADDAAVRGNRLALLQRLADRLGSVAAIEHLSV